MDSKKLPVPHTPAKTGEQLAIVFVIILVVIVIIASVYFLGGKELRNNLMHAVGSTFGALKPPQY